jgi:glycosyltransferase involved in cell wall biosynthesis
MIIPFPQKEITENAYMREYIRKYRSMGYEIVREKVYFWERKVWYTGKWLLLVRYLLKPFTAYMIHQHTIPSSGPGIIVFLLAAKLIRRRVIVVSHETVETYAKHLPRLLQWIAYAYEWLVVGLSAVYVVHNRLHFDELASFAPVRKMEIIPLPIPASGIQLLPGRKTTWGFYGMLCYKKGVDLLINAYQRSPAGSLPPLRIMGAPAPDEDQFLTHCRKMVRPEFSEVITFTGFVVEEDKEKLFADIALMIFPYRYISQSAALSEACMYGIPYLVSDVPYFLEYQTSYGCGTVFTSESVESLHTELLQWSKQPLTVTDTQWRTMYDSLSIDKCAERFRQLIEGRVRNR